MAEATLNIVSALIVGTELAGWRRAGQRPCLWWRDDDAREPTLELDRLIEAAGARPLALAAVPDGDLLALAGRLARTANVAVGQHGVDHQNRRAEGARPSEYCEPPTVDEFAASIREGRARMAAAGLAPAFYTPPWNHAERGLGEALVRCGFTVLSASTEQPTMSDGMTYLSAEIDLLRWKGGARFKGAGRVLSELARAMRIRRAANDYSRPIGLLTHHLVQDEPTWRFLKWLLPWLDSRADWVDVRTAEPATGVAMACSGAVC